MSMSPTLAMYMEHKHIPIHLHHHRPTEPSFDSALSGHIPTKSMVKGIVLEDELGYLMAAIPADSHLDLAQVQRCTGRKLKIADEYDLVDLFRDCEIGAIPALGQAYGMTTLWDEQLAFEGKYFIEAGDHENLVELSHIDFMELMKVMPHGQISLIH